MKLKKTLLPSLRCVTRGVSWKPTVIPFTTTKWLNSKLLGYKRFIFYFTCIKGFIAAKVTVWYVV
jgi:hypothetical protein